MRNLDQAIGVIDEQCRSFKHFGPNKRIVAFADFTSPPLSKGLRMRPNCERVYLRWTKDKCTLRGRGTRVSWLVSSASREARRARFMYKEIYVPVDNSDYSNQACVIGVDIARQSGGRVAGCHA